MISSPIQYRKPHPFFGLPENDNDGYFVLSHPTNNKLEINCIVGTGLGWEHVSISLCKKARGNKPKSACRRVPNWEEMCYVKELFWSDEDTVIQYHPPKKDYINNHPYVLHLWRPTDKEIPRPPTEMIGIKGLKL